MRYVDRSGPVKLGFPTPIFHHCWPAGETGPVNAALKAAILARREEAPGTELSNVGGWQSEPDFMDWEVPELESLRRWIHQAFGAIMDCELGTSAFDSKYVVNGWANINEYGDYNRTHIHSNNHWSGVYYVDLGKPDKSIGPNGAIEFIDPRPAVGVLDLPGITASGTWTIMPEPGLMLMFPSWLRHSVLPYYGESSRITIAFNLRVGGLTLREETAGG